MTKQSVTRRLFVLSEAVIAWLQTFETLRQPVDLDIDGLSLLNDEPQTLGKYAAWLATPGMNPAQLAFISHIHSLKLKKPKQKRRHL